MLANQMNLPDVQPSREPVRANEVKPSRDNSQDRNFDRIMREGQRKQEQQREQLRAERRQRDGNEAKALDRREPDRPREKERTDTLENDKPVKSEQVEKKPVKAEQVKSEQVKSEHQSEANNDHCEHEQTPPSNDEKSTEVELQVNKTLASEKEVASPKVEGDKDETSEWLDTILSIASDNKKPKDNDIVVTEVEQPVDLTMVVDTAELQKMLKEIGSEFEPNALADTETMTLAELQSMLPKEEFQALVDKINSAINEPTPDTEFEQLLAQLNGNKEAKVEPQQNDKAQLETNLQQTAAETSNNKEVVQQGQQTASQVNKTDGLANAQTAVNVANTVASAEDDKQAKFKQSSLMAAMQATNQQSEADVAVTPNSSSNEGKQSVADLLAPTTKVIDFGQASTVAATGSVNATSSSSVSSLAASAIEQATELDAKAKSDELDMSVMKTQESPESKLASLLGQLGQEEVKTSDLASKAEKVNVAGVTLDKTLQMPKLDNIAQAKGDVVLRENILFNKQELANQMQTQVGLMMARNMKSVDIRLDPPELGSMQVKLSLQNDQASVSFVVSSSQAKDALENSLPKLREMLEQQGLQLADSDVNQQQSQAGHTEGEEDGVRGNGLNGEGDATETELEEQQQMINRAINSPWNVSYYA